MQWINQLKRHKPNMTKQQNSTIRTWLYLRLLRSKSTYLTITKVAPKTNSSTIREAKGWYRLFLMRSMQYFFNYRKVTSSNESRFVSHFVFNHTKKINFLNITEKRGKINSLYICLPELWIISFSVVNMTKKFGLKTVWKLS